MDPEIKPFELNFPYQICNPKKSLSRLAIGQVSRMYYLFKKITHPSSWIGNYTLHETHICCTWKMDAWKIRWISFWEARPIFRCWKAVSFQEAIQQIWSRFMVRSTWYLKPGMKKNVVSYFLPRNNKKNGLTPWKFNIAPEEWWLEDEFPFGEGNFSGAMLNFRGVSLQWFMK